MPCFRKMGMTGIKWWPCLFTRPSYSVNINEEAFLKVSFKNIDWFQIWKNYFFQKGPKNKQILKNLKFFLHFYLHFQWTFQWYIVCFHTPNGFSYTLTLLPSHLNWPPLYEYQQSYPLCYLCIMPEMMWYMLSILGKSPRNIRRLFG